MKRILDIKTEILSQCPNCSGKKCDICLKEITIIDRLVEANIPITYWFTKLKEYKGAQYIKEFLFDFITNIKTHYQNGSCITFAGTYGAGKTTALAAILKNAIFHNYQAYYTAFPDMIALGMDYETKSSYLGKLNSVEFLAIDEVDARHFSSSEEAQRLIGSIFEKVIRYRTQNKLPLLLATNHASLEEVFAGQHRRVVDSLLSPNAMQTLTVVGKDQRKTGK